MKLSLRSTYLIFLVAFFVCGVHSAYAAQLIMADRQASAGSRSVPIPIELSADPGEEITAIQFDISYDSSKIDIVSITSGAAAQSAGKTINTSNVFAGSVRIVIFGINANISPGGLIANVRFDIDENLTPQVLPFCLTQKVASDAQGDEITLSAVNGSLTITAAQSNSGDSGGGGGCFIGLICNP